MSGFEVAGIVLGVFPLLQESAKGLGGVLRGAKMWWRFEREFESFVASLEIEHIKFSQNMEILLAELEISGDERDRLQNDSTCTLWYETHIQVQLKQQVQDRYYDWFMRQLHEINSALSSLHGLLMNGQVYRLEGKGLDNELFRVKTSFSHSKDDLISKVSRINDNIYEFLQRAAQVPRRELKRVKPECVRLPRLSLTAKDTAEAFYKCLQSQLKCNCSSPHAFAVTVAQLRNRGRKCVYMGVLFLEEGAWTQIKIESAGCSTVPHTRKSQLEEVTHLRQQVSTKNRIEETRKNSPKSIFMLAAGTLSRNPDTPQWPTRRSRLMQSVKLSVSSIIGGKKQEPLTNKPICEEILQTKSSARTVRFVDVDFGLDILPVVSPGADFPLIHDLCSSISGGPCQSALGYLQASPESRLYLHLHPPNQTRVQECKTETIDDFLEATPRRDTRIKIGYDLVLAILMLGGSPWVPQAWSRTSLFLVRDPGKPVPQPYLSHGSLRQVLAIAHEGSAAGKARSTLFSLGVLLLELVFREKLESQPFRARLMGSDGAPNEETDFATALLWQQRVEEQFGDELADAIKRCLICMFDSTPSPDLNNPAFLEAIWQQVLLPMEKFLSAWTRG